MKNSPVSKNVSTVVLGEKSADIFGGQMMNVFDKFSSEMNVELQGENIDKFSAGIEVEKFACVKKCFNGGMGEKTLIFLVF